MRRCKALFLEPAPRLAATLNRVRNAPPPPPETSTAFARSERCADASNFPATRMSAMPDTCPNSRHPSHAATRWLGLRSLLALLPLAAQAALPPVDRRPGVAFAGADARAGDAGGGQHRLEDARRGAQSVLRRSDVPALLRHSEHAARTRAAIARLRRDRRCSQGLRADQQPRRRRRRRYFGDDRGRPHGEGQGARHRSGHRPRGAADSGRQQADRAAARRFGQACASAISWSRSASRSASARP